MKRTRTDSDSHLHSAKQAHAARPFDLLSSLPPELACSVLKLLDAQTLSMASRVSHSWRCLCLDDWLWYALAVRARFWYGQQPPAFSREQMPPAAHSITTASQHTDPNSRSSPSSSRNDNPGPDVTWHQFYCSQIVVNHNWSTGRHTSTTLSGHMDVVLSIKISGDYVISGSRSCRILVARISTGETVQTIETHNAGVSCIDTAGCTVFSGSWDKTVKMWTQSSDGTLQQCGDLAHSDALICLRSKDDGFLVTGTLAGTVHLWDVASSTCVFQVSGSPHEAELVSSVDYNADHIFSGSGSHVSIWCKKSGQFLMQTTGHTGSVTGLHVHGRFLLTCSEDKTAIVWTVGRQPASSAIASGVDLSVQLSLGGHREGIRCLTSRGKYLVTGAYDQTLRVWDMETGHCLHVLSGHGGDVNTVDCDGSRIVSGSDDKLVKIWDFSQPNRQPLAVPPSGQQGRLSWADAAEIVLSQAAEPMSCDAIFSEISKRQLLHARFGRTPSHSLNASLHANSKTSNARFVCIDTATPHKFMLSPSWASRQLLSRPSSRPQSRASSRATPAPSMT
ncbi:WD40-repeat-containing domain protein [Entophlyctis helioformis]|nr:WD40-repeat-containing domain protein [Entophlyctis helioformis]